MYITQKCISNLTYFCEMAKLITHQNTAFYITLCVLGLMTMETDGCTHRKSWAIFIPKLFPLYQQDTSSKVVSHERNRPSISGSVSVNMTRSLYTVDPRFLSIAIGSGLIKEGWRAFDFNSDKLKNMARAMSPAILRLGGTDADFLIFNNTNARVTKGKVQRSAYDPPYKKIETNFTMSVSDWNNVNKFSVEVGWDLLFDFNMLLRNGTVWDPTNAQALLEYTSKKGYHVAGWELGNEPNSIGHHSNITIEADQLGRDFIALRQLLDKYGFQHSFLVGPDITNPNRKKYDGKHNILGKSATKFLQGFLQSCGNSTYATTWHSYQLDGRNASVDNFTDPQIMNSVKKEIFEVQRLIQKYRPQLPKSWFGETAGAFGGGAPGLSNAYAGGFLWLDKLGISAANGVDLVIRQTFYGGSYGLLNKELNPTPVYWLSLLYKQLVGPIVLNASVSVQDAAGDRSRVLLRKPTHIRAYAHCTNNRTRIGATHSNGSITLYVMNLQKNNNVSLTLNGDIAHKTVYQYLLTPHGGKEITATDVKLNGEKLMLTKGDTIPVMEGQKLPQDESIILPPLTYGFYVIHANVSVCL